MSKINFTEIVERAKVAAKASDDALGLYKPCAQGTLEVIVKSVIADVVANTKDDLTIRELQTRLPWSVRYSTDFRSSPVTHKDFAHALTHIVKAAGGLAELVDNMDHDRTVAEAIHTDYHKYVADMVICALRMANTMPGGVLDLQRAVQQRLETKNNVTLGGAP